MALLCPTNTILIHQSLSHTLTAHTHTHTHTHTHMYMYIHIDISYICMCVCVGGGGGVHISIYCLTNTHGSDYVAVPKKHHLDTLVTIPRLEYTHMCKYKHIDISISHLDMYGFTYRSRERERERERGRETDRQTDRQTDRGTQFCVGKKAQK